MYLSPTFLTKSQLRPYPQPWGGIFPNEHARVVVEAPQGQANDPCTFVAVASFTRLATPPRVHDVDPSRKYRITLGPILLPDLPTSTLCSEYRTHPPGSKECAGGRLNMAANWIGRH